MNQANMHESGTLGLRRVPIEPKAFIIGFIAVAIFFGGLHVIKIFAEEDYLVTRTFYSFSSYLGPTAKKLFLGLYSIIPGNQAEMPEFQSKLSKSLDWSSKAAVLIWILLNWAIFSGAICRIVAYRISKDDTISVKSAFKFAWRRKKALLLTPFFFIAIVALLWGINYAFGAFARISFFGVGPIVFCVLMFFVILFTFASIAVLIALLFGFHLIPATIGSEGCDGIEAFIDVCHCVYARPWSYIIYHTLLVISLVFLVAVGGIFVDTAFKSSLVSMDPNFEEHKIVEYRFDRKWRTVTVLTKKKKQIVEKEYCLNKEELKKRQGEGEFQNKAEIYSAGMKDVWSYIKGVRALRRNLLSDDKDNKSHPLKWDELWKLSKFWACIGGVLGFFYGLMQFTVLGYVFAHLCAASTLIYLMLRKEVYSADFEEIWEEEAEEIYTARRKEKKKLKKVKAEAKKEEPKKDQKAEAKKDEKKDEKAEAKKDEKKEEPKKDQKG